MSKPYLISGKLGIISSKYIFFLIYTKTDLLTRKIGLALDALFAFAPIVTARD